MKHAQMAHATRRITMATIALLLVGGLTVTVQGQNWPRHGGERHPAVAPAASPVHALDAAAIGPITFTEPEFPLLTVVNGFSTSTLNGSPIPPLSFGYTVSGSGSSDGVFATGSGTLMYVDEPEITGYTANAVLTIDFGADVVYAEFGFGISCEPATISPGVSVTALDASDGTVGTTMVDAVDTGFDFPENDVVVSFAGEPFRSLELEFNNTCQYFAVDNLEYTPQEQVPAAPVAALVGLALLLLLGGWLALRRRVHA